MAKKKIIMQILIPFKQNLWGSEALEVTNLRGGLFAFLTLSLFFGLILFVFSLLRAVRFPSIAKSSPYECGFDPGLRGGLVPVHFYLVALLFIIFDVEIALLMPWVLAFPELGWMGLFSALHFLALFGVGFFYECRQGVLNWN